MRQKIAKVQCNNLLFLLSKKLKVKKIARIAKDILEDPGADSGGKGKSIYGWKNMARRKVKNGEKSPWGQRLTRPVPNGRRRSGFWLVPENCCVFLPNQKPERRRPFGTGLVRHCPQGLFSPFFTFLRAIFFRSFRLSLAPTICPWVFKDEQKTNSAKSRL